ncbi:MAG TPA: DUF4271 domain-containing protein [Salinivirgaceae bacterium]|nr:DUF4271 domain-containing protein [Salinivirgaceae bacterium]
MPQTNQNKNLSNLAKSTETNDTVDNLLTQTSDIPVYDVLAKKQFASPDKIELIKESFILTPLKAVNKCVSFKEYDPITNKIIRSENRELKDIKPKKTTTPTEKIATPTKKVTDIDKADTVELTKNYQFTFDIFSNKITKEGDTPQHTIFPIIESTQKTDTHFVSEHLINRRPKSEIKQFTNVDWVTGFNIIVLILIVYIRVVFGKFFKPMFQSTLVYNLSVRVFNEKNLVLNRFFNILNTLFLIALPAFMALSLDFYGFRIYNFNFWQHYLIFLALLFVIIFIKKAISLFIGSLFRINNVIAEYTFQGNLFLKISGLLIIPIIIIIPYMPENVVEFFIIAVVIVLLLFYFIRILRLFSITIRKGFSIFYLILYFCTLEIGPCLVIFKMLSNSI